MNARPYRLETRTRNSRTRAEWRMLEWYATFTAAREAKHERERLDGRLNVIYRVVVESTLVAVTA